MQSHRRKPTRLPRPWDSPGKNTGVGCHFLLQCMKGKVKVKSLSCVWLLVTPRTAAYQAPLSMGFSRWDYWSGLPCPPPGDLPDPKIEPASLTSPALAGRFFTTSTPGLHVTILSTNMPWKISCPIPHAWSKMPPLYPGSSYLAHWCTSRHSLDPQSGFSIHYISSMLCDLATSQPLWSSVLGIFPIVPQRYLTPCAKVLSICGHLDLESSHCFDPSPSWSFPFLSPKSPGKLCLTLCIWLPLLTAPGTALSSPRSPAGLTPSSSTYPSVIQPSP